MKGPEIPRKVSEYTYLTVLVGIRLAPQHSRTRFRVKVLGSNPFALQSSNPLNCYNNSPGDYTSASILLLVHASFLSIIILLYSYYIIEVIALLGCMPPNAASHSFTRASIGPVNVEAMGFTITLP